MCFLLSLRKPVTTHIHFLHYCQNTNPHLFKIQTQKHMGGPSVLYRTFGVYHFISLYFVAEVVFIILQVYFCSIYHFAQNDESFPAGSFSLNFRLRHLSFSWVIIFEVHFLKISTSRFIIFLGNHFPG